MTVSRLIHADHYDGIRDKMQCILDCQRLHQLDLLEFNRCIVEHWSINPQLYVLLSTFSKGVGSGTKESDIINPSRTGKMAIYTVREKLTWQNLIELVLFTMSLCLVDINSFLKSQTPTLPFLEQCQQFCSFDR